MTSTTVRFKNLEPYFEPLRTVPQCGQTYIEPNVVVGEDSHTPRAQDCEILDLQSEDEVSSSAPKQRLRHIFTRWGYSPSAKPEKEASWQSAQRALTLAREHGGDKPERLVKKALLSTLAHMEEAIENEPHPDSKPGKGLPYFEARFQGTLRKLVKSDHDDRVDAERVETIAKIDVVTAERQGDIRVKGTETRTEGFNQAAAKRIGANGAGMNGHPAPAAPERFDDDQNRAAEVARTWVNGFCANQVLDRVPGSTKRHVLDAFSKAAKFLADDAGNPSIGPPSRKSWMRLSAWSSSHFTARREIAAAPIAKAAPVLDRQRHFRGKWIAVSQTFADAVAATYPLAADDLYRIFLRVSEQFHPDNAPAHEYYQGLKQADIEAALEAEAAKEQERRRLEAEERDREKRARDDEFIGIDRSNGRVALTDKLGSYITDIVGADRKRRFLESWQSINRNQRILDLPAEKIRDGAIRMAEHIRNGGKPCEAAADAFPEGGAA